MADSLDRSQKKNLWLVRFVHAGGTLYYTDSLNDVRHKGNLYTSTPSMKVTLPEMDGLLNDEKKATITLPLVSSQDDFTYRVSRWRHAPVAVIIEELTRPTVAGPATVLSKFFHGDLDRVYRNKNQNANQITLEAKEISSRLANASLGAQCLNECLNVVGDVEWGGLCGVSMAAHTFHATLSSIDGREVTITGIDTTGKPDRYFHMGTIALSGLIIRIRDWRSATPTKFYLDDMPPAYWAGQTVRVKAGCDGTITKCRFFGGEEFFLGLGVAMPAYDPQREVGGA